jgi:molecular chaperone GrpE
VREEERDRLVAEFARLLEESLPEESEDREEELPEVDLATLLSEMALLRNEVRLETRQSRTVLGELKNLVDLLGKENERLRREAGEAEERAEARARQGERSLLLGLLEVRDRLAAGLAAAEAPSPEKRPWWRGGAARESGRLDGVVRGIALTLSRLDDLLESRRVRPVEALDRPFDPALMKAVEAVEVSEGPDGWVVRELRKGYRWEGELLRAAEVAVVRKKEKTREERTEK